MKRSLAIILASLLVVCCDYNYIIPSDVKEGAKPVASFTFERNDLEVHFTSTSTDAESYFWDFGDGTTSTEASPVHVFSSAGTYTVTLKVNSAAGYSSSCQGSCAVAGRVTSFYSSTPHKYREGGFGKIVDFDATASENAVSIAWDFGDGTTIADGDSFSPTHEFPSFGTFKVKATTTGFLGDKAVYETDFEVVPDYEMIRGGGMEASDAQYWTVKNAAYSIEFGCTSDGPSGGSGGCLKFGGVSVQGSHTTTVYQGIDIVEGEKFLLSAQVKWDADGFSNGVLFWCLAGADPGNDFEADGKTPIFNDDNLFISSFNDWVVATPLPPYDGDLSGYNPDGSGYGHGYGGPGRHRSGRTYGVYTAPFTGTVYLGIELRCVWGNYYWGNFYFDNVSFTLIPED